MMTGDPGYIDARADEATPLNEGGGRIDLARANAPLVFAAPSSLSFGLLKPGAEREDLVALSDAGGGAGTWTGETAGQAAVTAAASVTVPGTLDVTGDCHAVPRLRATSPASSCSRAAPTSAGSRTGCTSSGRSSASRRGR